MRRLRGAGLDITTYLTLPTTADPLLFLPLQMPAAIDYALQNFTFPAGGARRLRRRAVRALLSTGLFPPVGPRISVEHGRDSRPALVAAAAELGVPDDVEFFVRVGGGDPLSRGAFFLFAPDRNVPSWVLKFARVAHHYEQFDADEHGLELAEQIGASGEGRAPRLVGRFQVDGRHAALETAAVGKPLGSLLNSVGLNAATMRVVEGVAEWIARKDIRSRAAPSKLRTERERLEQLVAESDDLPFGPGVTAALAGVPGVVLHNDLGCWNVVTDGRAFVAVDWESARSDSMPLWDLWYFIADAAATADDIPRGEREQHLCSVFRGQHELSPLLFRLTRRVVDDLGIEDGAVGTIATLGWLHHSRSHVKRAADLERHGFSPEPAFNWPKPKRWFADPALGLGWRVWREGV